MDNAGCHPEDLVKKYSNIKVVFLPPNTTSVIQPLDLRIIKKFKVHYRLLLLLHVLAKIDEADCSSAHSIVKSVTILHAIRRISQAWEQVKSDTICKCFRKAGILDHDHQVVSRIGTDDPFADIPEEDDLSTDRLELSNLIGRVLPTDTCTVDEFINVDNNQDICYEMFDGDDWESEFFANKGNLDQPVEVEADDDSDSEVDNGDEDNVVTTVQKIISLREVVTHLEDIQFNYNNYNNYYTVVIIAWLT